MTRLPVLQTSIEYLKGVGPQRADVLKKEAQIFTFGDLLFYFPFRFIDRSKFFKISDVRNDKYLIQLKGTLSRPMVIGEKRGRRLVAELHDDTGTIELIWFKGIKWLKDNLKPGAEYIVFGKPNNYRGVFSMPHPDLDLVSITSAKVASGLQPVYSSTDKMKKLGLDSRGIWKLQKTLFSQLSEADVPEILPARLLQKLRLINRWAAIRSIHLPKDQDWMEQAMRRLKFEELFLIQLKVLDLKLGRQDAHKGFMYPLLGENFNLFYQQVLPFELTTAQKRVLKEIRRDTLSGNQMNRLLQGDVGSGKTIVALMTMLMAVDNGFQACMMAPTEILAQQHFQTLKELLSGLGLEISFLTGSVKGKERKVILKKLEQGELHLVVGTHALIEEKVKFQNLGLVIIDEQHRFGVAQRAKLWQKNKLPPHVLVMTATPIPRTLAMTLYGDLDVSVIDELPPGRKPVTTVHRKDSDRLKVFGFMKKEIAKGRQVYVVYPMIKESEKLDYKYLKDGYESIIREFPRGEYRISIMHGQMKAEAKEYEMQQFAEGKTNIMVATTVIEVGVNVPNASVMIIESAERFGLSQLHQLRGRVGRGAEQSFCILMTSHKLSADARKRLRTMCETNDGFRISEVDMELRGPGDIEGTQQSGILNLKVANILTDGAILKTARKEAAELMEQDPYLELPPHLPLKKFLQKQIEQEEVPWSRIS